MDVRLFQRWSTCALDLFDDPNPDISNPALAVCALTLSGIQARPNRIPSISYADTLGILQLLRAFQLGPSQTGGQQRRTTNKPFVAVFGCFPRDARLAELWPEVFEHMLAFQRVGAEVTFASVVGVLLRREYPLLRRQAMRMGTAARLLRFCGFLREPEAVERARKAVGEYLKDVPGDLFA